MPSRSDFNKREKLTAKKLNAAFDDRIQQITGDRYISVQTLGGKITGIKLNVDVLREVFARTAQPTLVKVTGNETGGGKYEGQVFNPSTGTVSAATNLDSDDVGSVVAEALVMILNMAEEGKDTHDITEATQVAAIFPAVKMKAKSDHSTPRDVYVINGFDAGNCSR